MGAAKSNEINEEWPQIMVMSEFRYMTASCFDFWNISDSHFGSITRMVQSLVNYPDKATNAFQYM